MMQISWPPYGGKHLEHLHRNVNIYIYIFCYSDKLCNLTSELISCTPAQQNVLGLLHIQINTVAIQAKQDVPFVSFFYFILRDCVDIFP